MALFSKLGCSVVALTWLLCGAAGAQANASEPPAGYYDVVNQALAEFDAGHFEEARSLFARAHAIYPNARTLRGLGVVEFELRHYHSSADYLTQALASRERPLEGELRKATEQTLARAQGFLGTVRLALQPQSARVMVDGLPNAEQGQTLVLQAGDHLIEIQALGYTPEKRSLSIKGGDSQTLEVALQALPLNPQPHEAAPSAPRARNTSLWPWVAVGVSGVLLTSGVVLIAVSQHDLSKVEDAKKGSTWSQIKDAYGAARTTSTLGFTFASLGIVGVASSLLWHFAWDKPANETPPISVGPAHVALSGRF